MLPNTLCLWSQISMLSSKQCISSQELEISSILACTRVPTCTWNHQEPFGYLPCLLYCHLNYLFFRVVFGVEAFMFFMLNLNIYLYQWECCFCGAEPFCVSLLDLQKMTVQWELILISFPHAWHWQMLEFLYFVHNNLRGLLGVASGVAGCGGCLDLLVIVRQVTKNAIPAVDVEVRHGYV